MAQLRRFAHIDAFLALCSAVLLAAWISQSTTYACTFFWNCNQPTGGCQPGAEHVQAAYTYAYYSYQCPPEPFTTQGCCGVAICWWYDEAGHCSNNDMEECVYEGWCWV